MIVQDVMSSTVCLIDLSDPIWEAARVMAENDVGALPVAESDCVVGMITDRDIAVRAVAEGRSPDTPVGDVMSKEIVYCFDDDDVDRVARRMGDHKIRRLPVVNRDKRLVGIVSLGDLALTDRLSVAGSTVAQVSEPGGAHSQAAH
jgi:CBS domain-containing protein